MKLQLIILLFTTIVLYIHAKNIRVFLPNYYEPEDEFRESARNTAQLITPGKQFTACVKFTLKAVEPNYFLVAFGENIRNQKQLFGVKSRVTKLDADKGNPFRDYVRRKQVDECLFYFHPFITRVAGIGTSRSIPFVMDSLVSFPRDPFYDPSVDPYGMAFENSKLSEKKKKLSSNIFLVELDVPQNVKELISSDEFSFITLNSRTKRVLGIAESYTDTESYDKDSIASSNKNIDVTLDTQKQFKLSR